MDRKSMAKHNVALKVFLVDQNHGHSTLRTLIEFASTRISETFYDPFLATAMKPIIGTSIGPCPASGYNSSRTSKAQSTILSFCSCVQSLV